MAKLPGIEDLGRTPDVSGDRAIGVSDTSGFARGEAAWGQATQQFGKGLSSLGEETGGVGQMQSKFEYSRAHSDYLTKETDLRTSLLNDTDYTTLKQRYEDAATRLRDEAGDLITSPNERQRFYQNTQLSIVQGIEGMTGRAQKMAADANGAWVSQTNNKLIDQGVATDDPIERTRYIDAAIANIDGRLARGEIGPTEALKAKQDFAHQYALADGIVRSQRDPQGVINELQAAPGSGDAVTNRILKVEGFGKNDKSSARGAGQFIDSTWLDVLKRNRPDLAEDRTDDELLALRNDKTLGRQMTDAYRRENSDYLKRQGIEPTAGNQYLAHLLGPAGAAAVIKADPTMPAIDALTDAFGEKKAQAMVDANPSILNSLAGNVRSWADGKMGGAGAHDPIYSILPPAMRAQLAQHAQEQLDKQTATDISDFKTRLEDTLAEAGRNGFSVKPVTQGEFVKALGAKKGLDAYSDYQLDLKLRSDVSQVARMTPQQQDTLIKSYDPKPGEEGFADQAKRQAALQQAIGLARKARDETFASRVTDSLAEATRTGATTAPIDRQEFVDALGHDAGLTAWQNYSAELKAQRDIRNVPTAPGQQNELVSSYQPVAGGPDYVAQAKRQDEIVKAVVRARKERDDDPAQFAINRIASVQDAFAGLSQAMSDPLVPVAAKQAAARDFVNKTTLEQQKAGVAPSDVRILPKGYVETLKARLDNPQDSGGTANVVQQIKNEAALWGDSWPQVYRQIAPEVGPLVRVIGSGVSDASARILTELAPQKLSDILKDESTEKSNQVKKDVLTAFTPFIKSMAGNEGGIALFNDFRAQGEKLSAYYIVNGMTSADASGKAFKELIGDRYEFRDSWRAPKGLPQSVDDIQRGTVQALRDLETLGIAPPRDNITGLDSRRVAADATAALANAPGLAEKGNIDLLRRPQVKNADGSISTVRSLGVNIDGRETLIPTVSDDGRIMSNEEAIAAFRQTGRHLGKFDTPENATAFAQRLHQQQEVVYAQSGLAPDYLIKAKADAIRRDGKWVTAPDESGLALVYNDEAVRGTDGKPLILPWSQLAALSERSKRQWSAMYDTPVGGRIEPVPVTP